MEEGFKFYVRPRGAGIGNSRHRADRPLNHGEGARPSTIVGYRLPAFDTAEYKIFERRGLEEKLQSWIEKRKATFLENKSRTGSSVLTCFFSTFFGFSLAITGVCFSTFIFCAFSAVIVNFSIEDKYDWPLEVRIRPFFCFLIKPAVSSCWRTVRITFPDPRLKCWGL